MTQKRCETAPFFSNNASHCLEQSLLQVFSSQESSLKILRGLPRLYHHKHPSKTLIKDGFSDLGLLKIKVIEHFLLPLYEMIELPQSSRIFLYNFQEKEIMHILKQHFQHLDIDWIDSNSKDLKKINSFDLILSTPNKTPHPSTLLIGEPGFLESSPFSKDPLYCMGLHFLEYGIITFSSSDFTFQKVRNEELLKWLFQTIKPSKKEIENYEENHHFYFADCFSEKGAKIYLYALLASESTLDKDIDLCVLNSEELSFLIDTLEQILEPNFNIKKIEIHQTKKVRTYVLAKEGKTVRILSLKNLIHEDVFTLLALSKDFVGVSDTSLPFAISLNKIFFYDKSSQFCSLIKDLIALAENRISQYPGAIQFFRLIRNSLCHSKDHGAEWVDELYFQEQKPWNEIAKHIGKLLKHPSTKSGFNQLNGIIQKEYSFNEKLCQIVKKNLIHSFFPDIAFFERTLKKEFQENQISAKELLHLMHSRLFLKSIGRGAFASIKAPR